MSFIEIFENLWLQIIAKFPLTVFIFYFKNSFFTLNSSIFNDSIHLVVCSCLVIYVLIQRSEAFHCFLQLFPSVTLNSLKSSMSKYLFLLLWWMTSIFSGNRIPGLQSFLLVVFENSLTLCQLLGLWVKNSMLIWFSFL